MLCYCSRIYGTLVFVRTVTAPCLGKLLIVVIKRCLKRFFILEYIADQFHAEETTFLRIFSENLYQTISCRCSHIISCA